MNDRLKDLPAWAVEDDDNDDVEEKKGDIEMAEPAQQPKHMEIFFREVEAIKTDIESVTAAAKQITQFNEEALKATTTEDEKAVSNKLRPLVDETNKLAKKTKTHLALLKEETKKLKDEGKIKPTDLRIRENMGNTLTRKFIDEMKSYQTAQQKYKNDIKKKVARQVQIVKPGATDEEIDAIMRSDGGRDALYRETILAGGVNDQVKTAYSKVAGKYQDVLALEHSVAELHQMFLDFALLTEQQGELLDQIEYQVRSACDYVEDGNVQVYESIEYQKKTRKKQCIILLIAMVAIVVILFATGIIKIQ